MTAPRTYELRTHLAELRADAATAWRELEFAGSLQARLDGVGVLDAESALSFGAVGPAARAAGIRDDVRTASPHLAYEEFAPAMPESPDGDVAARFRMRAIELEASLQLLESLLAHAPARARRDARGGAGGGGGRRDRPTTPAIGTASRAPEERPSAPSSSTAAGSRGCICAPPPMRTGRRSHTRPPATSSPTSR